MALAGPHGADRLCHGSRQLGQPDLRLPAGGGRRRRHGDDRADRGGRTPGSAGCTVGVHVAGGARQRGVCQRGTDRAGGQWARRRRQPERDRVARNGQCSLQLGRVASRPGLLADLLRGRWHDPAPPIALRPPPAGGRPQPAGAHRVGRRAGAHPVVRRQNLRVDAVDRTGGDGGAVPDRRAVPAQPGAGVALRAGAHLPPPAQRLQGRGGVGTGQRRARRHRRQRRRHRLGAASRRRQAGPCRRRAEPGRRRAEPGRTVARSARSPPAAGGGSGRARAARRRAVLERQPVSPG